MRESTIGRAFTPPRAEAMTRRQRWLALIMLAVSLTIVMMDMTILVIALPDLAEDLHPSSTQQLWIVDVYSLILAGLLIPMSALADRKGRKKLLLCGFGVFGVASLLVLFVNSPAQVIALRALLGAAGAMIMPTTLSMIRTIFSDPRERATALAVWSVVSALGAVIGPPIGGALLKFFSWHSAFLINVPFVILAVAAGANLLPESRNPTPPKWDLSATALSIIGMLALVWSIKQLAHEGWSDVAGWTVGAIAVILLVLFVARCLSQPDPLLDVRLFATRAFTASTLAAFTAMLAVAGLTLLLAQWLQLVEQFSPLKAGIALLPMAAGSLLLAPFAPALAIRFGARAVLAGGLVITALGLLLLATAGNPLPYGATVVPLVLVSAGTGSLAIGSAIIMGSTPQHKAGSAAAIEEAMYDLGNVVGIAVLGSIAAGIYRARLDIDTLSGIRVTTRAANQANESLTGALDVAHRTGDDSLSAKATEAFTSGLLETSLIAGVVVIVIAVVVFMLVPRTLDISTHGLEQ